mmetsp:Transcript_7185/g.8895  ORF Transcript_7185/g.8895 Transcript_7185/m.8895 type:complete len:142 (-) Transcript_7185:1231-1656(-)
MLDDISFDLLFGPVCKVSSILETIMNLLEEKSQDVAHFEPMIGALYCEVKPHLNLYKAQKSTIPQMRDVFKQTCEQNENFKTFVSSDTTRSCLGGYEVLDVLTNILEFASEYDKHLENIYKHTPDTHIDHPNLRALVESVL